MTQITHSTASPSAFGNALPAIWALDDLIRWSPIGALALPPDQIGALQGAVEASERAVEANKIGFRIGTRINPDVLNAEQQFYASVRDLMKSRADLLMQWLRLKAAAGELQEQDIAAVDALINQN